MSGASNRLGPGRVTSLALKTFATPPCEILTPFVRAASRMALRFHAMVQELQQARDAWQAQTERLALMAPTVIAAPGPFAMPEAEAPTPVAAPEPTRRSWVSWWFGWWAA
jgi:hypothetical protein